MCHPCCFEYNYWWFDHKHWPKRFQINTLDTGDNKQQVMYDLKVSCHWSPHNDGPGSSKPNLGDPRLAAWIDTKTNQFSISRCERFGGESVSYSGTNWHEAFGLTRHKANRASNNRVLLWISKNSTQAARRPVWVTWGRIWLCIATTGEFALFRPICLFLSSTFTAICLQRSQLSQPNAGIWNHFDVGC